MVAKNESGTGAPIKAPEPARGESAGAGSEREELRSILTRIHAPTENIDFVARVENNVYIVWFKSKSAMADFTNAMVSLYHNNPEARKIIYYPFENHMWIIITGESA